MPVNLSERDYAELRSGSAPVRDPPARLIPMVIESITHHATAEFSILTRTRASMTIVPSSVAAFQRVHAMVFTISLETSKNGLMEGLTIYARFEAAALKLTYQQGSPAKTMAIIRTSISTTEVLVLGVA